MASCSPPSAKISAGAAVAAAAASWTPTGGRAITVRGPHHVSGKYSLEVRYDPRQSSKYADRKMITSVHADYPGKPSFLGCLPRKTWSTEAAAKAAIDHFRAWVDGGRRKQTATANAARQPPPFDGSALPERYSERRAKRAKVDASVSVWRRAGEVLVGLVLTTATVTLQPFEYNAEWSARASELHKRIKAGRREQSFDVERALGQTITDAERSPGAATWGAVLAQAEKQARLATRGVRKARGKGRGQQVSVNRGGAHHARADRHVQRKEVVATKQELRMRQAHEWRVEHIERLKSVLLNGSVTELLGRSDEELSREPAQLPGRCGKTGEGLQEPPECRCVR